MQLKLEFIDWTLRSKLCRPYEFECCKKSHVPIFIPTEQMTCIETLLFPMMKTYQVVCFTSIHPQTALNSAKISKAPAGPFIQQYIKSLGKQQAIRYHSNISNKYEITTLQSTQLMLIRATYQPYLVEVYSSPKWLLAWRRARTTAMIMRLNVHIIRTSYCTVFWDVDPPAAAWFLKVEGSLV